MNEIKKFPDRYADMLIDMLRRAAKKGRVSEDESTYEITGTDRKKIADFRFPGLAQGKVIDFDGTNLIVRRPVSEDSSLSSQETQGKTQEEFPKPQYTLGDGTGKREVIAEDYIMWIGYGNYQTIESFIEEAQVVGVSKKVSRIPKNMVPGESRVFLVHDEGVAGDGVIFGYFVIDALEIILHDEKDLPKEYAESGKIRVVTLNSAYKEPKRLSGYREIEGAMYLVGKLTVLNDYRDYTKLVEPTARRFRSYRKVDGYEIMNSTDYKTNPKSRTKKTIWIPEGEIPKARSEWTDAEWDFLYELVNKHGKPYLAFKEFERQTNRSLRSIEYQWFMKRKQREEKEQKGEVS